jgi:4-aminobutyrate aminotransferase-like enzyme
MVNGYDGSRAGDLPAATRELLRRRDRALGSAYRLFYDQPLAFTHGSGVHLFDTEGNAYLDAYNNVPSVGHSHPHVTEAVTRQLATLNTHTRYLTDGVVSYAERLLATHDLASPARAMFTCTGSEANDLALRVARHHTGQTGVIVTANAYHGVTAALAELSPSLGPNVPLGTHVRVVPAPSAGVNFTTAVAWAISDLERHGLRLAAFLADSLFSSDGVLPDPAGFLAPIAGIVRAAGGLYIADEVQSGFARTGSHMWGYQRHGLVPDIVTMGKPMGNGLPIAGLVGRQEVLDDFGRAARYFNTYGGNPVCVAAASAVLDVLDADRLPANAAATGAYLKDGIARLAAGSPLLGDVRGAGLYLGVDVTSADTGEPSAELASAIVNRMRERRVLISATGPHGSVLKIRPPLPFGPEHADQFLAVLSDVLSSTGPVAGGPGAGGTVAGGTVAGAPVAGGPGADLSGPGLPGTGLPGTGLPGVGGPDGGDHRP